jgi:hypothetical protein
MMIVPGFLIALVTFPGVIVREAAHMFFCKMRRVAVFEMYLVTPGPRCQAYPSVALYDYPSL